MVSRLQMKLKQKLGVAAVFALGIFVVISSSMYTFGNEFSPRQLKLNNWQSSGPTTPISTSRDYDRDHCLMPTRAALDGNRW